MKVRVSVASGFLSVVTLTLVSYGDLGAFVFNLGSLRFSLEARLPLRRVLALGLGGCVHCRGGGWSSGVRMGAWNGSSSVLG